MKACIAHTFQQSRAKGTAAMHSPSCHKQINGTAKHKQHLKLRLVYYLGLHGGQPAIIVDAKLLII